MSSPVSDIVGAYDVRGLVDSQLTPDVAEALGGAWVLSQGLSGKSVVIGHDMRSSSPRLQEALAGGVARAGAHVIELGLCSTDMVYYASGTYDAAAVMITASHNPASYNGLKFTGPGATGLSRANGLAQIATIADELLAKTRSIQPVDNPVRRSLNVVGEYAAYLRSLVDLTHIRPLRVVVDAANGMAGYTVPHVFAEPSWAVEIIPLYFDLDGTFPNHEANPLDPANLVDLQRAVVEAGADVGLAFDGDADRCFVVDEKGQPVSPSAIGQMVAAREITRFRDRHSGETPTVIHNLICSRALPEKITAMGAIAHRTAVGHSLIKNEMAATGAIFGAEHSAHYYFRDFWGADNGMLAALHVLAELGHSSQSLSQLCAGFCPYANSGEINYRVSDTVQSLARIVEVLGGDGEVDLLDGVTISSPDKTPMWWLNARASNTEPLLRINVEAASDDLMVYYRDTVAGIVTGPS